MDLFLINMNRKINPVIAISIVAVTAAFAAILIWIVAHKPVPTNEINVKIEEKNNPVAISDGTMPSAEAEFIIEGQNIYQKIGQDKQLLFTNAENVNEVRRGPDGKTIHFKLKEYSRNQARCANLFTQVTPPGSNYNNPPPSRAPWDYQKIGNAYTIESCGGFNNISGFINNTNYFSYITVDSSKAVSLFLLDTATQVNKIFPVDSQIWNQTISNSDNMTGFKDIGGSTYYYPQDAASVPNGKLLLAVGRLLIAADITRNTLLGTELLIEPKYHIAQDAFGLTSNPVSPLVLISSSWEGPSTFDAVLDLSGNNLQVIDLHKYPQPISWFETPLFEWNQQVLLLHFYTQKDITNQVSQQDLKYFDLSRPVEDMDKKNSEIQTKLMSTGKYIEVVCDLPPGMFNSACYALIKDNIYQVTPGQGIIKLK